MTNVQNDLMKKPPGAVLDLVIGISSLIRHSSFGFRRSPFSLRESTWAPSSLAGSPGFCGLSQLYLRWNFSTRPVVSTYIHLAVKNGWHAEQISTVMFLRVLRVVNLLPHPQVTVDSTYSGMNAFLHRRDSANEPGLQGRKSIHCKRGGGRETRGEKHNSRGWPPRPRRLTREYAEYCPHKPVGCRRGQPGRVRRALPAPCIPREA